MIGFFRNTFLTSRFFIAWGLVIFLFALSFAFPGLIIIAKISLIIISALLITDVVLLFSQKAPFDCKREMSRIMSLGSSNRIMIYLKNESGISLNAEIIDEQPEQLQSRDFLMKINFQPGERKKLAYSIVPLVRGEYKFGRIHVFFRSLIGFANRRISFSVEENVSVYPSIIQMKELELKSITRISNFQGEKKIRRIGQSYEFEQIKNYVKGDDYRRINWKATGRKNELMVNTFVDEKSQQIYCVIDNSRAMRMPFEGLSLLDYAVNSSLVIANTALLKQDKAGLLVFSDLMEVSLKAENKRGQMNKVLESLYKIVPKQIEANYEYLYFSLRGIIRNRSLLFLYTNFESMYALERVMPVLRKINKLHLLVVILFENTEVYDYSRGEPNTTEAIYYQTVAQLFVAEKAQMVQTLNRYGIQTILTKPKDLSINTLNKYLELKSKGII